MAEEDWSQLVTTYEKDIEKENVDKVNAKKFNIRLVESLY